jgi:hypothetical protein
VYFSIRGYVRPYTYGVEWILADHAGRILDGMGTLWARNHGMTQDDTLLSAVGIERGESLRALKVK